MELFLHRLSIYIIHIIYTYVQTVSDCFHLRIALRSNFPKVSTAKTPVRCTVTIPNKTRDRIRTVLYYTSNVIYNSYISFNDGPYTISHIYTCPTSVSMFDCYVVSFPSFPRLLSFLFRFEYSFNASRLSLALSFVCKLEKTLELLRSR